MDELYKIISLTSILIANLIASALSYESIHRNRLGLVRKFKQPAKNMKLRKEMQILQNLKFPFIAAGHRLK